MFLRICKLGTLCDVAAGGFPRSTLRSRSASAADLGTTCSAKAKSAAPATIPRRRIEAADRRSEMPWDRSAVDSADRTSPATAMSAAAAKASGTTSTRIGASFAWK